MIRPTSHAVRRLIAPPAGGEESAAGGEAATGGETIPAWCMGAAGLALITVIGASGSVALGSAEPRRILWSLPVLFSAVAIIAAVRLRRPLAAEAWLLLAIGRMASFLADVHGRPLSWAGPSDPTAETLRMAAFVLSAGGLIVLARHLTRVWDRTRWIDSVAVSLSFGLAGSTALVWPSVSNGSGGTHEWIIPTYPAIDLLLVLLATRSLLATKPRSASLKLLTIALVVQLAGDVAVLWARPAGAVFPDGVRVVTVGIASVALAAAALVESSAARPCRIIPWRRLGWVRFTVLTLSVVLPLTVLVGLSIAGPVSTGVIAVLSLGTALIAMLVLVRVSGLVSYADALADERHRSRFEALADHSHDAIVIVDQQGSISWISPAVRTVLARPPDALLTRHLGELFGADGAGQMAEPLRALCAGSLGDTVDLRATIIDGKQRERVVEGTATNLIAEPSVEGIVIVVRDVTERSALQNLAEQAFLDPLTGLANRTLFADRIAQLLTPEDDEQARSHAVLFLDLDDFKIVNDTLGHRCGDQLLMTVAERLATSIGAADTAARLGGDEFAVLLRDLSPTDAVRVAERILAGLSEPVVLGGRSIRVSASIGVACTEATTEDPASLLNDADSAMYESKRRGKGQVSQYWATDPGRADATGSPAGPRPRHRQDYPAT